MTLQIGSVPVYNRLTTAGVKLSDSATLTSELSIQSLGRLSKTNIKTEIQLVILT